MKHLLFNSGNTDKLKTAILIKDTYFDLDKLRTHYLSGLNQDEIIAFNLPYNTKKPSATEIKKYFSKLLPALEQLGITTIYCADANYFKILTKETNADRHIGYVLSCTIKNHEHLKVIYGINYGQLLYNPNLQERLQLSLDTLISHSNGTYQPIGNIVNKAIYPTVEATTDALEYLLQQPVLSCDIETTGLVLGSQIVTIAFAWNQHEGMAFNLNQINPVVFKRFFETYSNKGKLIFHNATFDIKQIIFNWFMKDSLDYVGLLHGLHTMCRSIHDTKVIAYLALNTTAEIELGLKPLSHEYTGNYAENVSDISNIPIEDLLEYNLKDCLATWFVFNKYYPIMLKDNQQKIYQEIMLPSIKTIIQMELVGMPINLNQVYDTKSKLEELRDSYLSIINTSPVVMKTQTQLQQIELDNINSKLKTKQHSLDKVSDYRFNPNSGKHLQYLLYKVMQLPVLDTTASKQPSTSSSTIEKLLNHTKHKDLLNALIGLNQVDKILTTFIPAFEKAMPKGNYHYLHGNFNLGGTVSGRLSSSNPNLQNLPANSIYGKEIKKCFSANKGWIFAGADFNALESRINALLTKDTNKLKVYTEGYDSHSINAYGYWKHLMPDIENTLESINSIKDKYPHLRQESKRVTFAAQYGGSYITFMHNCGFTEQEAKQIEANYHKLYKESDLWIKDKLDICCKQGYIDVAFGLRIRTPLLAKSILGNKRTLYEATAEARSVGNAISGQSYGLLTNRAINAFLERVWASDYKYDIMPVSLIHDAIYLMIKDDIRIVEWVNNNLIECMQWQDLPEIQHNIIHLEAELDLYYPNWSTAITLPNNISQKEIMNIVTNTI